MEPETERLALAAIEGGALATVSGARVRDELIDLLRRAATRPRRVERMRGLGIDRALHPELEADPELVASPRSAPRTIGADRALAAPRRPVQRRAPGARPLAGGPRPAGGAARRGGARRARRRPGWPPRCACATRALRAAPPCCRASRRRRWRWRSPCGRRPSRRTALGGRAARRPPGDHGRRPDRGGRARRDRRSGARSTRRWRASSTAWSPAGTRSSRRPYGWRRRDRERGAPARRPRVVLHPARAASARGHTSRSTSASSPTTIERRAREPPAAGAAAPASSRSASRWDGRCTAPTCASGTARRRQRPSPGRAQDWRSVDGHLTAAPGVGLLVLVADCYPGGARRAGPGGDAALRLARPGGRNPREGALERFDGVARRPPSGPASARAATRSGGGARGASPTSRAWPTGGCSTCAR